MVSIGAKVDPLDSVLTGCDRRQLHAITAALVFRFQMQLGRVLALDVRIYLFVEYYHFIVKDQVRILSLFHRSLWIVNRDDLGIVTHLEKLAMIRVLR